MAIGNANNNIKASTNTNAKAKTNTNTTTNTKKAQSLRRQQFFLLKTKPRNFRISIQPNHELCNLGCRQATKFAVANHTTLGGTGHDYKTTLFSINQLETSLCSRRILA
jgi:hypothetical protein